MPIIIFITSFFLIIYVKFYLTFFNPVIYFITAKCPSSNQRGKPFHFSLLKEASMVYKSAARGVQSDALQVRDNRIVVGEWSGDLMELAAASGQVRSTMRAGQHQQARALVQRVR
tara:strand:+ start:588 stop:932 length:345 start_codon:yes stop_codon:yes gene_type:complete